MKSTKESVFSQPCIQSKSIMMPDTTRPFAQQLQEAVSHISGEIEAVEMDELSDEPADAVIPADPDVKNYSYTLVDDKVYYRENSIMKPVDMSASMQERIKGMESKRLGLCQKSLFVVPNHLTEQWASDFLRLYPGANILAATKKDFEPANRKKFCSRIATGDYDAVIIGHSQFEKIPLSQERQVAIIERQIDEIELAIAQAKADNRERYTIKQMEKSRKSLLTRLEKLNDASRKDNVVTFEQLGVASFCTGSGACGEARASVGIKCPA